MNNTCSYILIVICMFAGLTSITHAEPPKESPAAIADLTASKKWLLVKLGDQELEGRVGITLAFDKKGRISGSGGVNRFGGEYELKADGLITIQNIISTKVGAHGEKMNREILFFQLLDKSKRVLIANENMIIESTDKDDKPIKLVFGTAKKE